LPSELLLVSVRFRVSPAGAARLPHGREPASCRRRPKGRFSPGVAARLGATSSHCRRSSFLRPRVHQPISSGSHASGRRTRRRNLAHEPRGIVCRTVGPCCPPWSPQPLRTGREAAGRGAKTPSAIRSTSFSHLPNPASFPPQLPAGSSGCRVCRACGPLLVHRGVGRRQHEPFNRGYGRLIGTSSGCGESGWWERRSERAIDRCRSAGTRSCQPLGARAERAHS
jgi:hypothetical protein